MTGTTTAPVHGPAPRQNRDGHPCPPWCVTDHETVQYGTDGTYGFHGSARTYIKLRSRSARLEDEISVRAIRYGCEEPEPHVALAGTVFGAGAPAPRLDVAGDDMEGLAVMVEMLARATPGQHRQLAAAIRQAAAGITGAPDARASR